MLSAILLAKFFIALLAVEDHVLFACCWSSVAPVRLLDDCMADDETERLLFMGLFSSFTLGIGNTFVINDDRLLLVQAWMHFFSHSLWQRNL